MLLVRQNLHAIYDLIQSSYLLLSKIWGKGDTVLLPKIIEKYNEGLFKWIGGGTCLTSHTHVRNVAEGLEKAALNGKPGEIYFITDGKPSVFKEFITRALATRGVNGNSIGSVPYFLAYFGGLIGVAPLSGVRLLGK
jgi:nucleoside-diphosphate-sugar epimerase